MNRRIKPSYNLEKFFGEGQPLEAADLLMKDLHKQRAFLTTRETELVGLAIFDGLTVLFPERIPYWQAVSSFPFDAVVDVRLLTNEKTDGRAGWNDYHMCRWFINHDRAHVMAALNRIALPNPDIGGTCIWMLKSVSTRHPELVEQIRDCIYSDELDESLRGWLPREYEKIK